MTIQQQQGVPSIYSLIIIPLSAAAVAVSASFLWMPAPSYALDKVRQHVRRYVSIEKGQNLRADVFIAERSVSFSTFPNARATPSAAPPSVAYKRKRERESLSRSSFLFGLRPFLLLTFLM